MSATADTATPNSSPLPNVTPVSDIGLENLRGLLAEFGLTLVEIPEDQAIPGSFWGEAEAGLQGNQLLVRTDTPVHSALHESGHYVCMDPARRAVLDTDAGGDYDEENAVCYWQIMVCDRLPGMDRGAMCRDMDAWGYTFRLGSAAAWFEGDAEDARAWLIEAGLLEPNADRVISAVRSR
ncbi:hypothetical protein V5738_00780 [Salinisphaera sp. SPP-AMP-43]|uniref:hypothetical protein n=1 Tax=Salinisphaera sp. SPP-AMP-43 TaxID=3121288 RepID=UPI003C6E5937